KDSELQVEYATSDGRNEKFSGTDRSGDALLLDLHGSYEKAYYNMRYSSAAPEYLGYYSDMDLFSAGLSVPLVNKLRINGNYRRERRNLDDNPLLGPASFEEYRQIGVENTFGKGTTVFLDLQERIDEDRLPVSSFDYREDSVRLGVSQAMARVNIYASTELGTKRDFLTDERSCLERYHASFFWRPTAGQSYHGFIDYDNNRDGQSIGQRSLTAGVGGAFQITDRTFLEAEYQSQVYREENRSDSDMVELRVSHTFVNAQKVLLRGRRSNYGGTDRVNDTAFIAEYTIPFGIPVSRKMTLAVVEGHVVSELDGRPLAEVLVTLNGFSAVTDREGRFRFNSVIPGAYYLNVDLSAVGKGLVPCREMPLPIEAAGGRDVDLELPVTKAASLSGQLRMYRFENGHDDRPPARELFVGEDGRGSSLGSPTSTIVAAACLSDTIVELRQGDEVKRRLTDSQGRFCFEELRPGKWSLAVEDGKIPGNYYLEQSPCEVTLAPGDREERPLKILPRKRTIQFLQEEGVLYPE
ncbi:MAG: carboxypeptidase-like regulatory domain-containing protein, partial [Smithellaceae bacterium]|nr:carboxypeptidase-like regulatory domain-containing protein [Smithellaceae bacterium]